MNYDPTDLAMLAAGFAQGAGPRAGELSIARAEHLQSVAVLLGRLFREVADEWDGPCWAYEVAEPLGYWIGHEYLSNGGDALPSMNETEERARQLIDDAMEGY